jgi:hypothetical protein
MGQQQKMTAAELVAYNKLTPAQRDIMRESGMSLAELMATKSAAPAPTAPPKKYPNDVPRPPAQLYIGIDPGKNTGFALWKPTLARVPGRFVEVNTLTFVATIRRFEKLAREFGAGNLRVRIEDVRANKPTFSEKEGSAAVRERMSQNIGANKRDCELLIDFLEELGIPYDALPPRKRATGAGKVTQEFFSGILGFPERSSQHARDAGYLVVGL